MEVPVESDGSTRATSAKYKPNKRRARVLIDKRRARPPGQGADRAHSTHASVPMPIDPIMAAAVERAARDVALSEKLRRDVAW